MLGDYELDIGDPGLARHSEMILAADILRWGPMGGGTEPLGREACPSSLSVSDTTPTAMLVWFADDEWSPLEPATGVGFEA
jgi:hypothetical protein